ncbi:methylated-DNA--[protein]-cysteine S-methyltransferase [Nesterenkonia marinintestina]|uniref:methylated-DNA--[protein]-cysteine S-methyltransferase n=1 Tax=Nesterenkonia marinintestina TaxID=2979865 RepID=UPI0021BE162B|nr:methylated-DNA--[protein]-cysteine S-methyltransferase [Nesterenkonia sp. GX14115]
MAETTTLNTPDGPFTIIIGGGAVLASGWTDDAASLTALIHRELCTGTGSQDDGELLGLARSAVEDYYAGDHSAPGRLPVRQRSGPYREHAWEVLRGVEPGHTLTYSDYAERTGNPAAVRAAAGACAHNAAALFVPCHRILRSDGGLGGFRYGTTIKESLLRRESRTPSTPTPTSSVGR